jgi:hypothetical protein
MIEILGVTFWVLGLVIAVVALSVAIYLKKGV